MELRNKIYRTKQEVKDRKSRYIAWIFLRRYSRAEMLGPPAGVQFGTEKNELLC